ncbi:MoaD/ThiS family protein [Microbacterium caowuchunii]|jgi:sulfur-carrier protein|uniref:MoaD/ThiS family protein n=1 Tax=Microbacterium caowuchunii TaxID=2614638 RepID=UPI001247D7E6|nr:MoaD/ThiS family protein [Microbacterium caowuchunii]QEV99269.1 MoaD/ThiS family protein [Microbacterium caowuchunii]
MARVRYFAAAEEMAGRAEETRTERTLGDLRRALAQERPGLGGILPRCAVLVGGSRTDDDAVLAEDTLVDVLPPFAGG